MFSENRLAELVAGTLLRCIIGGVVLGIVLSVCVTWLMGMWS